MTSENLRSVALQMLGSAHKQRNDAEDRVWAARDEVTRLRLQFLEAQQRESIAQRDLDRAQEFLSMIWTDVKPLAEGKGEVGPDPAPATQSPESASDIAALGPNGDIVAAATPALSTEETAGTTIVWRQGA